MKITIAIHEQQGDFSKRWIEYCREKKLDFTTVDCRSNDIITSLKHFDILLWNWDQASPSDQLAARQIITAAERIGVLVFPDAFTSWHYDDKIAQKYILEAVGAPLVPSHVLYERKQAEEWIRHAAFPKVFKLRCGAGSANVRLVRSKEEAFRVCKAAFGPGFPAIVTGYFGDIRRKVRKTQNWRHFWQKLKRFGPAFREYLVLRRSLPRQRGYVYFQEFLSNNEFDTRVNVIGSKAFAFRRMNRPRDFRASGSGNVVYDPNAIDQRCLRVAFETTKKLNAVSMAYDCLFDSKGEVKIIEIGYSYASEFVHACPGYWDEQLNWHEGHFWPQDLILEELLLTTEHRGSRNSNPLRKRAPAMVNRH